MAEKQISDREYKEYLKLKADKEKQKRYQQVLNAKTSLQAKWARLNGCPVKKKHAEYYLGIDENLRDNVPVMQLIDFAEEWDESKDATAHAVSMLGKSEGTEKPEESEDSEDQEAGAFEEV